MTVDDTASKVIIANVLFMAFWILLVTFIVAVGQRSRRLCSFRAMMVAQWKPALANALVFLVGMALGGRGLLNPYAIAIFCQTLIGLALARSIFGFEPFPVARPIRRQERPWRNVVLMLTVSLVMVVPILFIGSVGLSMGAQIFGETIRTDEAMEAFRANPVSIFFLLLSGAGIAEETPYRLVLLSLFWRWTRRRWLAVLMSAAMFGAYHLTPLDGLYRTFWRFPASQFLASSLIGILLGYVYVKRGYESAVLSHTFGDWIPFLLFANA
jgi:membrane protease YdiL (CAAX protease family)